MQIVCDEIRRCRCRCLPALSFSALSIPPAPLAFAAREFGFRARSSEAFQARAQVFPLVACYHATMIVELFQTSCNCLTMTSLIHFANDFFWWTAVAYLCLHREASSPSLFLRCCVSCACKGETLIVSWNASSGF